MKVLVLHHNLGVLRGGGENFTRNLFAVFTERGHRVTAAFFSDRHGSYPLPLPSCMKPLPIPNWLPKNFGQATLSAIGQRLPFRNGIRTQWERLQEAVSWRNFRWQNERFMRKVVRQFDGHWNDFDCVYVHGNVSLASAVAQHRPTVLRLPGPVTSEFEPLLRSVHAVCANGDALDRIRTFLGDHAIELPPGIDARLFTPGPTSIRSALGWAEQDYVVGYTGRLFHLKGVDLLAAAFRDFSQNVPSARLLMVGSGEEEQNIRSVLRAEIGHNKVHLEPGVRHEQLPQWYRAMDLLVMPSRYENFSNSILEALACGVPFLGSDVGGNRLLASSGAGWLFERGSVSALAGLLQKAFNERSDLRAHGLLVSPQIRNRYNWEKTAEMLECILTSRLGVQSSYRLPRPVNACAGAGFEH
jgi:glycosyltransferase involved in cell wall biosynthesis